MQTASKFAAPKLFAAQSRVANARLDVLDGPVDPPQKRVGKIVALDRECSQSEVLDFEYSYQSFGNFDADKEWLKTDIETATADLTIELIWDDGRRPDAIWRMDDGERKRTFPLPTGEDNRYRTKLKLQHLSRGQKRSS